MVYWDSVVDCVLSVWVDQRQTGYSALWERVNLNILNDNLFAFVRYERDWWRSKFMKQTGRQSILIRDTFIRKYDVNVTVIIHHKGGYWNCAIRIIRILESLTAWGILLRPIGQMWVFLRAYSLRWWSNT